ncbi:uncharacterized protein LY89DRAFT_740352 [Mollisia scopiformis]|uniref:Flavin-containing monooxygenase n=1 Tax=Mollisia scopiformis TaxID=149040 RepID=A0A132BBZ0_MOLSC|nr:uncharacterized protein LY89DRAFT_740352 [Mollisia scopiformis]KUJ09940.1 hypothetical protein LY89DRAFT_740352 [Mollisia scopiformis]
MERNAKKVAVIGSGVAGLAAAKYLLAERDPTSDASIFDVTVFERHSEIAGIWNFTSPTEDDFQTPMYPGLETNVPRTMMTYKYCPYLEDVSLFPTHDKIKQYLEDHSTDIGDYINLNSETT